MPALNLLIGAKAEDFYRVLSSLPPRAAEAGRGIRKSFDAVFAGVSARGRNQSTIFNPEPTRTAEGNYAAFWENTLNKQASAAAARGMEKRKRHEEEVSKYQERLAKKAAGAEEYELQRKLDRAANMRRYQNLRLSREAREAEAERMRNTTGVRGFVNNLKEGIANRFIGIGAAVGAIYGAARFVADSYMVNIAYERLQNTFKSVLGSASKASDEIQMLRQEADKTGFVFLDVAPRVANFMAAAKEAGLSAEKSRSIVSAVLNAGVSMGLDSSRQGEALLALEQMLSRGSVMSQELRLQWSNAMPGGLAIFSKALGVTNKQLLDMVESGNLLSKEVLPKVAEQLQRMFPPDAEANQSLKQLAAYQNALNDFKKNFGEFHRPVSTAGLGTAGMAFGGFSKMFEFETWMTIFGNQKEQLETQRRMNNLRRGIANRIAARERETDNLPDFRVKPLTKEQEKEAEKVKQIEEKIREERRKTAMIGETQDQKRLRLQQELKDAKLEVARIPWEGVSNEEAANRQLALVKAQNAMAEFDASIKETKNSGFSLGNLSQGRAGSYVGGPAVAQLEVSRDQLRELQELNRKLGQRKPFDDGSY